jgi:acyl-CoA hydrolase
MSRIVPFLKEGAGVVTTRGHVHWVVTEYGITDLFGKNLKQRAKALIDLAHPDHREQLDRAMHDRFYKGAECCGDCKGQKTSCSRLKAETQA